MFKRFLLLLLLMPTVLFAQDSSWMEYDISERNATGLNAIVRYPKGYSVEQGKSGYTVAKFQKILKDNIVIQLGIGIEPHGIDKASFDNATEDGWSAIAKYLTSRAGATEPTTVTLTKVENQQALIFDSSITTKYKNVSLYMPVRLLAVFTPTDMVTLTCGVGGMSKEKKKIDSHLPNVKSSVCQPYFNSLVLKDRYNW